MKAVKWFAPRDMRLVDIPKPEPKPWEVLIHIESTGVCGSDMHYYEEGRIGNSRITEPLILGHEFSGIVEAVGKDANPDLLGQRVAVEPGIPCMQCEWCRKGHYNVCEGMTFPGGPGHDGALCEYKTMHSDFCFPVPPSFPADVTAMIEPLAVAIHTVELARIKPGDSVAIFGLGPIGLLTAQVASLSGATTIIGIDPLEYRVLASRLFNVNLQIVLTENVDVIGVISDLTEGRNVDVAIDCARSSQTPALACQAVHPAGRCVFTGISGEPEVVLPVDVARHKELSITWCRRFAFNYPTAIDLIFNKQVDVRPLITHSFSLEQANKAFELVSRYEDSVLKASIDQDWNT